MRLDRTRIVIRERDLWEIVDLSLLVLHGYWQPLLSASCLLLLPMLTLDWYLLSPLFATEHNLDLLVRHSLAMACLIAIQAPLATAGATLYLGLDVFYRRLSLRELCQELGRLTPRLLWYLGVWRLILPSYFLAWSIDPDEPFSTAETWLIFLAVVAWCLRAYQPFLVEALTLERETGAKLQKRLRAIRTFGQSDAFSRQLVLSLPSIYIAFSVAGMAWLVTRVVMGTNQFDLAIFSICWTSSLALTSLLAMIVSYLSYLDLRIRREGWELSLLLGAAASATEGTA